MAAKSKQQNGQAAGEAKAAASPRLKPSSFIDTRVIYCGDNLEQLKKLPDACVDLIYIDPPFNSNRNYEVFWGETKEKRSFEDRHASTQAYIDFMRPRCVELARVLKKTGSFYYHCDWHASHYVKVMLDQIFGENNFMDCDPGKLAIAARLRSETTLPIKWIAARMQIGTAKGAKSVLHHLAQSQDQRKTARALEPCAQLEFQSAV